MIRSDLDSDDASVGVMTPEVNEETVESFRYRGKTTVEGSAAATPHSPEWLPVDDEC